VQCSEANEAANIIWENLSVQNLKLFFNRLGITFLILLIYIAILAVFVVIKQSSTDSLREFPPTLNCDSIKQGLGQRKNFKAYAELDKGPTLEKAGTGVYQCYC